MDMCITYDFRFCILPNGFKETIWTYESSDFSDDEQEHPRSCAISASGAIRADFLRQVS